MAKGYAASVYSQKSTTSAKSGRSFLSFTQGATIWPIFTMTKDDDSSPDSLDEAKQGIWKTFKNWIPTKKTDGDTITIKSSSDSIASSNSSLGKKWKKLLVSPTHYIGRHRENNTLDKKSPTSSLHYIEQTATASSIDTTSLSDKAPSSSSSYQPHHLPGGILVNAGGGSAQDIAEQRRRRKQRRLYLMRVQQQHPSHRHSVSSIGTLDNSNTASTGSLNDNENSNSGRQRHVGFSDTCNYSSSSTLLSTPPDSSPTIMDKLDGDDIDATTAEEQLWYPSHRVMFLEPSPVPRFRNEPPAPPPSPPYLIVLPPDSTSTSNSNETSDEQQQQQDSAKLHSLIADNDHSDIPTIFTTLPQHCNDHEQQHISNLSHILKQYEQRRSRLTFTSPLQRGQTITFSLQNTIPDDHIIIFKFLTSNSKLLSRHRNTTVPSSSSSSLLTATTSTTKEALGLSSSSSWSTSSIFTSGTSKTASSSSSSSTSTERYFVRPSAGKMGAGESHSGIMLFLNQVPSLAPGEILKDKILVRWAVIQRGTQVEAWAQQLKESTRRKWLEMLLEKWPDQVVERKTRISIRFV